jgi:[ribosomal protein S5]-alanine N-acetyltransferase
MTPRLETKRLELRPIEMADAPQIQKLFPQWEVVRFLSNRVPWPYPRDGAVTFIRDMALPAMERNEQWIWTLRLKSDPANLIGAISLARGEKKNRGFWIVPEFQGQGLMTEAADAVTDFWFEVLRFPVLRVPKAVENEASRRISLRQGMRVVATEEHDYVGGRFPSEIWEITAKEWRARRHRK